VSTKEAPTPPSYILEHYADPVRRYHAALFEGIQADAAKDGKTVTVLSDLDEIKRGNYPSPDPVPATRVTSSTYLAAMVVRDGGYHFMRRDNTTGLWSALTYLKAPFKACDWRRQNSTRRLKRTP
jgi:hypothetical protein